MEESNGKAKQLSIIVIVACAIFLITGITVMSVILYKHESNKNKPLVINELESTYANSEHVPKGTELLTEDEWNSSMGTTTYTSYEDYVSANEAAFHSSTPTITADGINLELFQYCDKYFKAYYGTERISPLFPMALSNCETQGRADYNITYSALFPSKVVDVNKVGTFDVTDVIADDKIFNVLSSEYSTRDRGCLQMSPTYGTNNEYLNSLMSGTEKDKLSKVDTSKHSGWVSGASSTPGDRFYLPDVLMRLQAAVELDVNHFIRNNYVPNSDMQLIAMLGIEHNSGWIFSSSNHSKKIGRWNSGEAAYQYCNKLGNIEFVNALQDYANKSSTMYMSVSTAHDLYKSVYNESYTNYCTNSTNAAYPIMVMYAYMKLVQVYTE